MALRIKAGLCDSTRIGFLTPADLIKNHQLNPDQILSVLADAILTGI